MGNIVTNVEIRGMQEEIRQSLSSQGMTRYVPKERKMKVQGEHYHFMADGIKIAMISSQSRIGTTTTALGFAAWLGSVGASVAYVEKNTSGIIHYCRMPMRWMRKQEGIAWKNVVWNTDTGCRVSLSA